MVQKISYLIYKLVECYGLALRQVADPRPLTMDTLTLVQFQDVGGQSGTGTDFNVIPHFLLRSALFDHLNNQRNINSSVSLTLRLLMSYIYIYIYIYMEHLFLMFLDHTQRRSTVGRTPLDE